MIRLTKKGNQQLVSMRNSIGSLARALPCDMSKRDLKALREGVDAMRRLMAARKPRVLQGS